MYQNIRQYNQVFRSKSRGYNDSAYVLVVATLLAIMVNVYCGVNAVSQSLDQVMSYQETSINVSQLGNS